MERAGKQLFTLRLQICAFGRGQSSNYAYRGPVSLRNGHRTPLYSHVPSHEEDNRKPTNNVGTRMGFQISVPGIISSNATLICFHHQQD